MSSSSSCARTRSRGLEAATESPDAAASYFDARDLEFKLVAPTLQLLAGDERGLVYFEKLLRGRALPDDRLDWIMSEVFDSELVPAALRQRFANALLDSTPRPFWLGRAFPDRIFLHREVLPSLLSAIARLRDRTQAPALGAELLGRYEDARALPLLVTELEDLRIAHESQGLPEVLRSLAQIAPADHACVVGALASQTFYFGQSDVYGGVTALLRAAAASATKPADCAARLARLFPPIDAEVTAQLVALLGPKQALLSFSRAAFTIATRGEASAANVSALVRALHAQRDPEHERVLADALTTLERRLSDADAAPVIEALITLLAARAAVLPEDGTPPPGMSVADTGAHVQTVIYVSGCIARVMEHRPASLPMLRARYDAGTNRLRMEIQLALEAVRADYAPAGTLAMLCAQFIAPPPGASDHALRGLAALVSHLAERGADPKPQLERLLASTVALDRRAGLADLAWFAARWPELAPIAERLAHNDDDPGVRRFAVVAGEAYERARTQPHR